MINIIFIKYGEFKFDIYNIKENIQSINSKNEIIETTPVMEFYNFFRQRNYNKIKDEMNIRFLYKFSKDLFFAKDINDVKYINSKINHLNFIKIFHFQQRK